MWKTILRKTAQGKATQRKIARSKTARRFGWLCLLMFCHHSVQGESSLYQLPVKAFQPLYQTADVQKLQYYQINGQRVAIANQLFIELKNTSQLDQILEQYSLSLVAHISGNIYLLSTDQQVLSQVAKLRLDDRIAQAYPDLIRQVKAR